jgi:YD repeat-containing protein
VFVTSDGTSATFVSDADVTDYIYDNPANTRQSGYLMLRDGTRYRIDGGKVTWMRDRNGNKLTFTYNLNQRPTSITDSLNRQVTITYGSLGGYDEISYKGFGGATRSIKIYLTNLQYALRSDYSLLTYQQLFPELNGASSVPANVAVIGAVELPNGKQYQFLYNSYAELARVVLPTGGAIEYDYAAGLTNGASSGYFAAVEKNIYRRLIERRVYPDGGNGVNYASRMTYSRPETTRRISVMCSWTNTTQPGHCSPAHIITFMAAHVCHLTKHRPGIQAGRTAVSIKQFSMPPMASQRCGRSITRLHNVQQ